MWYRYNIFMDDAIVLNVDDVIILLYWDTDHQLVHKNSKPLTKRLCSVAMHTNI